MATAYTDTVLNYSGMLRTKSNNDTRLIDAIFSRGRSFGNGIVSTGVRKVNAPVFALSSGYSIPAGSQPAITESASTNVTAGSPVTRTQEKNYIQIFQEAVDVSYLKSSSVGALAGINIAGQESNVTNELDFQASAKLMKMKKDLNYSYINGTKQEGTNNTTAYKTGGLIENLTTNAATYTNGSKISADALNGAITKAMENGFSFSDGNMELWVNPENLNDINEAYKGITGFGLPNSRTEGGLAITSILTNYGTVTVNYDVMIPAKTYLLLNMKELAVAELDTIVDGVNKGTWFYETLAKTGASEKGQLYAQAGADFGAEWNHIKITEAGA